MTHHNPASPAPADTITISRAEYDALGDHLQNRHHEPAVGDLMCLTPEDTLEAVLDVLSAVVESERGAAVDGCSSEHAAHGRARILQWCFDALYRQDLWMTSARDRVTAARERTAPAPVQLHPTPAQRPSL